MNFILFIVGLIVVGGSMLWAYWREEDSKSVILPVITLILGLVVCIGSLCIYSQDVG